MATNLFSGPNPFASFKEMPPPSNPLAGANPFGSGQLPMPPVKEDIEGLLSEMDPNALNKEPEPELITKFRSVQGLLSASFKNMPVPQD